MYMKMLSGIMVDVQPHVHIVLLLKMTHIITSEVGTRFIEHRV